MLEIILNTVWAATGIAMAIQLMRTPVRTSSPAIRFLAVACIALVLFPVISLSDDLHALDAVLNDVNRADQSKVAFGFEHDSTSDLALASAVNTVTPQFLHFSESSAADARYATSHILSSDALRAPPVLG